MITGKIRMRCALACVHVCAPIPRTVTYYIRFNNVNYYIRAGFFPFLPPCFFLSLSLSVTRFCIHRRIQRARRVFVARATGCCCCTTGRSTYRPSRTYSCNIIIWVCAFSAGYTYRIS